MVNDLFVPSCKLTRTAILPANNELDLFIFTSVMDQAGGDERQGVVV